MEILYEDNDVIVAHKPCGLLSEDCDREDSFARLLSERNGGYIGVIHRLDRGVSGVMVYAKTQTAAARLSAQVQSRRMKKEYLAIVHGTPIAERDTLCDLLFHDRIKNKTFVVDRKRNNVKEAILSYKTEEVLENSPWGRLSKLHISLQTGRTHQIRVQFASRGYPLLSDRKYGAPEGGEIGLCCYRIEFSHPATGASMSFTRAPSGGAWELFDKNS